MLGICVSIMLNEGDQVRMGVNKLNRGVVPSEIHFVYLVHSERVLSFFFRKDFASSPSFLPVKFLQLRFSIGNSSY